VDVPDEDQMRTQMFKTMAALERWADASVEFLKAEDVKQPKQAPGPVLDYSALRAACKNCQGVVEFEDYTRQFNSPNDTCTCAPSTIDDVDIPPNIKAIFEAIHKARSVPPIMACPKCRRPSVVQDPTLLCTLCLSQDTNKNWRKEKDAKYFFEGDVVIKGDLRVEGTSTAVASQATAPLPTEVEVLQRMVNDHHRALALIVTFGQFKDAGFFGTKPDHAIARLIKLKACENCVGTGWVARDETCDQCKRRGYIES